MARRHPHANVGTIEPRSFALTNISEASRLCVEYPDSLSPTLLLDIFGSSVGQYPDLISEGTIASLLADPFYTVKFSLSAVKILQATRLKMRLQARQAEGLLKS